MKGKKDSNKVYDFPTEIQELINTMFDDGFSIVKITEFLKHNYPKYSVDRETLSKYKVSRAVALEVAKQDPAEIAEIVVNKKDLLEKLIANAYQRLHEIRSINAKKFDPKWENFVSIYMELIRKLVETSSKLDEDFGDEEKIKAIVKTHLSKLLQSVYMTVKEICPEKMDDFQKCLKEKYEGIK